jgi:hypothetical protein
VDQKPGAGITCGGTALDLAGGALADRALRGERLGTAAACARCRHVQRSGVGWCVRLEPLGHNLFSAVLGQRIPLDAHSAGLRLCLPAGSGNRRLALCPSRGRGGSTTSRCPEIVLRSVSRGRKPHASLERKAGPCVHWGLDAYASCQGAWRADTPAASGKPPCGSLVSVGPTPARMP